MGAMEVTDTGLEGLTLEPCIVFLITSLVSRGEKHIVPLLKSMGAARQAPSSCNNNSVMF